MGFCLASLHSLDVSCWVRQLTQHLRRSFTVDLVDYQSSLLRPSIQGQKGNIFRKAGSRSYFRRRFAQAKVRQPYFSTTTTMRKICRQCNVTPQNTTPVGQAVETSRCLLGYSGVTQMLQLRPRQTFLGNSSRQRSICIWHLQLPSRWSISFASACSQCRGVEILQVM